MSKKKVTNNIKLYLGIKIELIFNNILLFKIF